jgi:hypothetical protein
MVGSWKRGAVFGLAALLGLACSSVHDHTQRTAFEKASERRLAAAKAGLDSLTVELRLRADTSRVVWRKQLDSLETERDFAARKLEQMRKAESKRWGEIKGELADMLSAIEGGIDTLKTRLHR